MRRAVLVTGTLALALASACSTPTDSVIDSEAAAVRLPGSSYGGALLTATLTGEAEIANGMTGAGDLDGAGSARITVNSGRGELCFELTVADIEPAAAAHIHVGAADVNGPVVVGLAAPTDGSSSGCRAITKTLAKALLESPAGYYVNVHNAEFPGGALRGQLVASED